jgi:hypothetical protein
MLPEERVAVFEAGNGQKVNTVSQAIISAELP